MPTGPAAAYASWTSRKPDLSLSPDARTVQSMNLAPDEATDAAKPPTTYCGCTSSFTVTMAVQFENVSAPAVHPTNPPPRPWTQLSVLDTVQS